MAIKFGFSDECGVYSNKRTEKQKIIHPFYSRALFLIDGDKYKILTNDFNKLKEELGFPRKEIKWAHIWSLRSMQRSGKSPKKTKDYYFLKDVDYHDIIDFAEKSLSLLNKVGAKTIFTITNNCSNVKCSEKDLFKMHITTLLQRVQYETQRNNSNLSVLFFDPINNSRNKVLRETYYEIHTNGDFVKDYSHIKDSLNLEYSHHSTGIQIADFLAGVMTGALKGYDRSIKIFNEIVRPTLRNYNNRILGAGICEIPTNSNERSNLRNFFNKHSP